MCSRITLQRPRLIVFRELSDDHLPAYQTEKQSTFVLEKVKSSGYRFLLMLMCALLRLSIFFLFISFSS